MSLGSSICTSDYQTTRAAVIEARQEPWPARWWLLIAAGEITLIDTDRETVRADMARVGSLVLAACCFPRVTVRRYDRRLIPARPGAVLRPATADQVRACREALDRPKVRAS